MEKIHVFEFGNGVNLFTKMVKDDEAGDAVGQQLEIKGDTTFTFYLGYPFNPVILKKFAESLDKFLVEAKKNIPIAKEKMFLLGTYEFILSNDPRHNIIIYTKFWYGSKDQNIWLNHEMKINQTEYPYNTMVCINLPNDCFKPKVLRELAAQLGEMK